MLPANSCGSIGSNDLLAALIMPDAEKGPPYDQVAIIGVGLIGGSIGLGLLNRIMAKSVVGIGRSTERLQRAVDIGAISEFSTNLEEGVADADVVVVCTPVGSIADFVVTAAQAAPPSVLITDGGSTKHQIVQDVHNRLGDNNVFVGSHPMAGSEQTGVESADADLYVDRDVILTPTADTKKDLADRCREFWATLMADVHIMSPEEHDFVVASISHSPHVVAALLSAATPENHVPFASTGWNDTTRVAAGNVEMWQQIIQQNKASLQNSLARFQGLLERFSTALDTDDDATIRRLLEEGKSKRDAVAS